MGGFWDCPVEIAAGAGIAGRLYAYLRLRGMDPETLSDEWRALIAGRFTIGDPDTVGERLTNELALGIDGFTINMPASGHIPGRVTLLGETAAKVVG